MGEMKKKAMDEGSNKDLIQCLEQRIDELTAEVCVLRSAILVISSTADIVTKMDSNVIIKTGKHSSSSIAAIPEDKL